IVDNHGLRGTNTALQISGLTPDLTIMGGASVDLRANQQSFPTLRNFTVRSNGWVTASGFSQVIVPVMGNVVIENGGGLLFDGLGGSQGAGSGQSGSNPFQSGGGGGHGGYGGTSGLGALGGNSYDSLTNPTQIGSSGGLGTGTSTNNQGGGGGGAVQLNV